MTVTPYVTGTPEWHAIRAKHIGASEVAALFDMQPGYAMSRYALWMVKSGRAEPPEVGGERVFWGTRLESLIAEVTAEAEGWTIRKGGYASDDLCPGLGASLDYEIVGSPELEAEGFIGDGILECKAVDWLVHQKSWTNEEPPTFILLQLQTQCAARGYSWGAVGALVSGNERRIYKYQARPNLIADIRRRAAEFWQSIRENRQPPVDGSESAARVLAQLYPEIADDAIDMSTNNEWSSVAHAFFNAGVSRREANAAYDEAKNRVVEILGGHKRAYGNGWQINTSITPENLGREPRPGELIGVKKEVRKFTVKEMAA